MRPTPPSGLTASKRSVPSRSSQNASSSVDHDGPKRLGYQNDSRAQEDYYRAVGIKIDEATEPGVSDEDAGRYQAMIKKIYRGNSVDGVPPKPHNASAGAAIAQGLRKRLKSSDEVAVMNTLIFIDELMRTIPLFYNTISNDKFFRQLWRLVNPDYKEQPIQIPFLTRSKNLRVPRVVDPKIRERVLILIRAWAETLAEMRKGLYDPKAKFFIERYETKRKGTKFPEVPKSDTPWVCPLPKMVSRHHRYHDGASSRSGPSEFDDAITIDEIENSVNLFSSLVDNATSASDLKSELCSELADKCKLISRSIEKISANLTEDKDLVRAISINDSLQNALKLYKEGLTRENWDKDDLGHIATVSLDSEDDESNGDVHKTSVDGPLTKFESMRIRSAEPHGGGSSSTWGYAEHHDRNAGERESPAYSYSGSYDVLNEYSRGKTDRSLQLSTTRSNRTRNEDYFRENDRGNGDYSERGRLRTRERDVHASQQDPRKSRQGRRDDSKSDGEGNAVELDSRYVRERGCARGESQERGRSSGSARVSKTKESNKKSKGVHTRKNESGVSGSRPDKARKGLKKKRAESSTGDDDSRPYEDDSESSSEFSDPPNEESFKLLADRFKQQTQSRNIKKSNAKGSTKNSGGSRRNSSKVTVEETGQDTSLNGARAFPQSPMMFSGNGMFPSGMPMAMNPMMMMGAPMGNPFGMYGSVNPMFMSDPMGMFNPYSTVNPAMYYQSMNPNFLSGMAPPMGGAGYGDTATGASNRSLGMGVPDGAGHRLGVPANHSVVSNDASTSQDIQAAQRALAYPSYNPGSPTREPGSSSVPHSSSDAGRLESSNFVGPGRPAEVAMHPGLSSQALSAPAPFNGGTGGVGTAGPWASGELSNSNEGSNMPLLAGGVGGLSQQQAERQAAMYQSAMHQAATAYHMAATAYKTMQGQAAFSAAKPTAVRNSSNELAEEEIGGHPSPSTKEKDS